MQMLAILRLKNSSSIFHLNWPFFASNFFVFLLILIMRRVLFIDLWVFVNDIQSLFGATMNVMT